MGLFSNIRKKESMQKAVNSYFKLMKAYTPCFSSFEGGVYEMELTRAAIHSFATHASKLKPEIKGSGNASLERKLQFKPNPLMDTKKYLYRLATIYMTDNNCFIAPIENEYGEITGFYPLLMQKCRITDIDGERYVRYDFGNGKHGACELERMGLMTQYQYRDELFGESNACLAPTMNLIHTNNQGIIEGVKNSASLRFLAILSNALKPKDVESERIRFRETNFAAENNGGVLLVDQKYREVKQIDSRPFVVNPLQMNQIKENVFTYFGTNEEILRNKFNSDSWNAYYEGKIEPFAIEASLVHTNMLFTAREISFGNSVIFTANRLQYLSNNEKLNTVTQLFDRGFLTHNQGLEIFNMSPVDGGDRRFIRKEYAETNKLENDETNDKNDITDEGEKKFTTEEGEKSNERD